MKFTKKRGYEGSIRKVWSNDKEVCFGVVGTVGDLLREGIFEYADYPPRNLGVPPGPWHNPEALVRENSRSRIGEPPQGEFARER